MTQHSTVEDFKMEHAFPHIGRRVMLLNARRIERAAEQPALILVAMEDMTDR